MAVDKAALLNGARVLPHDTVEVPELGEFEVRGLSRAEVVHMQTLEDMDAMEVALMSAGMVDPALTPDEVRAWRASSASEDVRPVSDRILELSGIGEGQQHEKERTFRSDPVDG